ncbi:MAG: hypothetical protein IRY83_12250 [Chloroflexi bacterium]|nr:hypothetical protein [Chloroflexota bacterium]
MPVSCRVLIGDQERGVFAPSWPIDMVLILKPSRTLRERRAIENLTAVIAMVGHPGNGVVRATVVGCPWSQRVAIEALAAARRWGVIISVSETREDTAIVTVQQASCRDG